MCGKVFAHYEPGWSPIREFVAAALAYSQSRRVIDFGHSTAPSLTNNIIVYFYLLHCFLLGWISLNR